MLAFHRFVGLCLRFADDFETSLDDWKPDVSDSSIMNLCMVSEGTYEVCSRTIAQKQDKSGNKTLEFHFDNLLLGMDNLV